MVEEKIKEYGESLSRPEPSIYPYRREIESSIIESCNEIGPMVADFTKSFPPTTSSCYESSRKAGGVQGFVREHILGDQSILDSRGYSKVEDLENQKSEDLLLCNWDSVWEELLGTLLAEAEPIIDSDKPFLAKVAGIPEPLKVRLVTRQSWVLNLLKPIQKAWHSKMRQLQTYSLIGGMSVSSELRTLSLEKGQKFVSGDYQAATDEIYLRYTKFAAEEMLKRTDIKLPGWLLPFEGAIRKLAIRSLTEIGVDLGGSSPIPVKRGQMMGHILSFPLLCLLNRSATCLAIPRDRWMRINGDDVLFPASPSEYKRWKTSTSHIGLKYSIGKNYYSRDVALINSEFYEWDKDAGCLVRIKVPNVGLLGYQVEMLCQETGVQILPWDQYGSYWNAFVETLSPNLWRKGYALFRKRYPAFSACPAPLMGPRELGCLGGSVPSDWRFKRSELVWMEAHRRGEYNFRDGISTDYARIQKRFHNLILSDSDPRLLSWGILPSGEHTVPVNVLPDPYSLGGGFGERLMAMRRWVIKPLAMKKARVFGRRRWLRFLQGTAKSRPILGGEALDSVLRNSYSGSRPHWYLVRGCQRGEVLDGDFEGLDPLFREL
jgi:hypothetical protein